MGSKMVLKDILEVKPSIQKEVRLWRNQGFIKENMYNRHDITEEEHTLFITSFKSNADRKMFVCFIDEVTIGILSYNILQEEKSIEFAYYLKNKEDLGKGYGAIMEYYFLNHAFLKLNAENVNCEVLVKNSKTIFLHKKFGFIEKNIYIDIDKCNEEICLLEINKREWENSKEGIAKTVKRLMKMNEVDEVTYID